MIGSTCWLGWRARSPWLLVLFVVPQLVGCATHRVPINPALNEVDTLVGAEAAYAAANENLYGSVECLLGPSKCVPGYPA